MIFYLDPYHNLCDIGNHKYCDEADMTLIDTKSKTIIKSQKIQNSKNDRYMIISPINQYKGVTPASNDNNDNTFPTYA